MSATLSSSRRERRRSPVRLNDSGLGSPSELSATLGTVGTTAQAYLRVPIGVAISVAFLGESLSRTAWIGLACVVLGVAAMTIPARRRTSVEPS